MKNINLIVLFIITIFFISCSQNEDLKLYDIVNIKELVFPLDTTKKGIPLDADVFYKSVYDYCVIDGIETLIIPINRNRLAFYDLTTKKEYHSVPLLPDRDIENFSYINKDSIFVFYNVQLVGYDKYEPIYFQQLNYSGKAKICDYDIDISNFNDSIDLRIPFIIENNIPLIINLDNIFFVTAILGVDNIGHKSFLEKQIPLFAYYSAKTKKIKLSKTITFPETSKNIYYNTYHRKIRYCLSAKNLPVLRFFYSSILYEWDYNKDSIVKHFLKSRIIDTIPPLRNEHSLPESLNAVYGWIFYDQYNKIYYSFLHLNENVYGNYYSILILADENFNYLGEILNPPLGGNMKFCKDNIVRYYYFNDSIHVLYEKLVKTDKPLQQYLDSVKNVLGLHKQSEKSKVSSFIKTKNPLVSFVKSKYPKIGKDYVLLTIYANGGCTSCNDGLKSLLNDNYKVFNGLPFYLIYTGSTFEVSDIDSYKDIKNIKLIKDSLGIGKKIAIKENKFKTLEPRLTIVKNNEIILDTIYDWLHIQSDLIPTMLENLGLKQ